MEIIGVILIIYSFCDCDYQALINRNELMKPRYLTGYFCDSFRKEGMLSKRAFNKQI